MVLSGSGSTSDGSMLTRASLSISPTGVSEPGVDDFAVAAAGEHLLHLLKEGMLWPLTLSRSIALTGVAIWLLPKDASASILVSGEEDVNPGAHGNVG